MLVTMHLPELDDAIFPATGDHLPIGAYSNCPGPRVVSRYLRGIPALLRVSPAYNAIRSGAHQDIVFSRPIDAPDKPAVAFQCSHE
jgi:hypothetical protein